MMTWRTLSQVEIGGVDNSFYNENWVAWNEHLQTIFGDNDK
jgi:hypothetical protein